MIYEHNMSKRFVTMKPLVMEKDDNTDTDIRNIKCGFVSVYAPLECKRSPLLQTYEIHSIIDFYDLIMFGNKNYESMFESVKHEVWVRNYLPISKTRCAWESYLEDSWEQIVETGQVVRGFQLLVAVYFNIHIVLHVRHEDPTGVLADEAKQMASAMKHVIEPLETIHIWLEPEHVEYKPLDNEVSRYEAILKQLSQAYHNAEELETTDALNKLIKSETEEVSYFSMDELAVVF